MGAITEIATSAPGYSSIRPNTAAPLAEMLRLNGYSTAQFGKCHEVPVWETSPMGPFDRWPTRQRLRVLLRLPRRGDEPVLPGPVRGHDAGRARPKTPEEGYHLTEDMADQAIDWVRQQKSLMPDKPFFMYFAPGATHAPHHVPKEWADKYKGQFDAGLGRAARGDLRPAEGARRRPADAELTARHEEIPAWDDMPDELKPVLARQMEVYAGLPGAHRPPRRPADRRARGPGVLDDTLVYYIIGDNGAERRGHASTAASTRLFIFNGADALETPEFMAPRIDEFGTPAAYNHYAVGWAHAMDTPYQWTKQVASHWGGTRNGTIVHWPERASTAKGEIRTQFHHVIDVAPTILEAAGIPEPTFVNGVQQMPLHGVSMRYALRRRRGAPSGARRSTSRCSATAASTTRAGRRSTRHSTPWVVGPSCPPSTTTSGSSTTRTRDWTQARDLAAEQPEKLHELQRLWLIEAVKYSVLPLDDRRVERFNPDLAGRPQLVEGQLADPVRRHGPAHRELGHQHQEQVARGHRRDRRPRRRRQGRHHRPGRRLRRLERCTLKEGRLPTATTCSALQRFKVDGDASRFRPATHQVRMEFDYDGGGLAKGGDVTLYVDGSKVGEGRVEATMPMIFSADETTDVGADTATPVSDDYARRAAAFTGKVNWVQIDVDEAAEDPDHLISPEERLRVAMARQ